MASSKHRTHGLISVLTVCCAVLFTATTHAQSRRINLEVLVVSAGPTDYGTAMVRAGLREMLVPFAEVDLTDLSRPRINDDFLIDATQPGVRTARFQAVVLPNEAPALSVAEKDALIRFEQEFKIRQLDAYVSPKAAVGLSAPVGSGTLDGATAQVTAAGKAAAFSYLNGPVPFEDLDPATFETFAYAANALPSLPANTSYTSYLDATVPGTSVKGSVLGVYTTGTGTSLREEMVITVSMNQYQTAQQTLFPGILHWLTYGTYIGAEKHSLAVHIDDIFMVTGRWSAQYKCTLTEDCPAGTPAGTGIRMNEADVDYLVDWQSRQGMKLDMVFNGGAYADTIEDEIKFPLGARLLLFKNQLRWVSHTFTHPVLGCIRNTQVTPWRCALDSRAQIVYPPYQTVFAELNLNINFARQVGIPFDPSELVTGEHSGLRRPPQDPTDNPWLVQAISDLKVEWAASDNSVEPRQRSVGGKALTVPRYPMNIFYNAGRKSENITEFNWLYASKADGGSGICASFTCLKPLSTSTGFDQQLVPREARATYLHALSNDPRPHYAHQANLAEDRIIYPVIDKMLADYRRIFNTTMVPINNPSLKEAGTEFKNRDTWASNRTRVRAYIQNGLLYVDYWISGGNSTLSIPVTVATTSTQATLPSYWGLRSGWLRANLGQPVQFPLAASVRYAR
jgi:hypothetical protein